MSNNKTRALRERAYWLICACVWGGLCLSVHCTWPLLIAPSVVEAFTGIGLCLLSDGRSDAELMFRSLTAPALSRVESVRNTGSFPSSQTTFWSRSWYCRATKGGQLCATLKDGPVFQWIRNVLTIIQNVVNYNIQLKSYEILFYIVYSWPQACKPDSACLRV